MIIDWLKAGYDLGLGYAMALVHVISSGAEVIDNMLVAKATSLTPAIRFG